MKIYNISCEGPGFIVHSITVVAKDKHAIEKAACEKLNVSKVEITHAEEISLTQVKVTDLTAFELFTLYEEFRKNNIKNLEEINRKYWTCCKNM